ncbi:MAG: tetratricopeptide repeat protein, partial [Candidatus Omnitrophica bacterium]|nr:tetratricopeptide repeat protein [Candidatus Omnitrophota bacterium]
MKHSVPYFLNRTFICYGLIAAVYFITVDHDELAVKQIIYKMGYYNVQARKDFNSGVLSYDLMARRHYKSDEPLKELALIYYREGQLDQAERHLLRARELDPQDELVGFFLAEIFIRNKKADKAYHLVS